MITDPLRDLPTFEDIEDAARRVKDVTVHTPLLRFDALDAAVGAPVWVKPEMLQRTGSFKMRGAWNRMSRIPEADRAKESREAIAAEIVGDSGATTVRPFDDSWIMAGQGTAGLEAARDAAAMGVKFGSSAALGGDELGRFKARLAELLKVGTKS